MNNTRLDRTALIAKLTRMVVRKDNRRFCISTTYRPDETGRFRRRVVIGLEETGGGWRRGYIGVEEGVLDYDAWPSTQGVYDRNLSYIGAKRILKLLGVELTNADVRKLREDKAAAEQRVRNANVARTAHQAFTDLDVALAKLVEAGALKQEQLSALRGQWDQVVTSLPTIED